MVDHRSRLEAAVVALDEHIEAVRADLERAHPGVTPELIRHTNGRYVLLEPLTALVQALTALQR